MEPYNRLTSTNSPLAMSILTTTATIDNGYYSQTKQNRLTGQYSLFISKTASHSSTEAATNSSLHTRAPSNGGRVNRNPTAPTVLQQARISCGKKRYQPSAAHPAWDPMGGRTE